MEILTLQIAGHLLLGLSSIPAVSMDRWRSPSDNRYARNAGVSIRYKKLKKNRLETLQHAKTAVSNQKSF